MSSVETADLQEFFRKMGYGLKMSSSSAREKELLIADDNNQPGSK